MADFVYVVWKIGDQHYLGDNNDGMKHGMPVCYYDPNVVQSDHISNHMKKCFGITMEPINKLAEIQDMLLPNMPEEYPLPENYKIRKTLLNFSDLQAETGISDLEDQWKSDAVVEPIDRRNETSLLIKSSDTLYSPTIDTHAITSGSYTFGSGGDYTDLVAVCADVGTPLVGSLTLNAVSSMILTASPYIGVYYNGYLLTITSANNHYGNYNNGYKIYSNVTDGYLFHTAPHYGYGDYTRNLVVENLIFEAGPAIKYAMFISDTGEIASANKEVAFLNLMIKGSGNLFGIHREFNTTMRVVVENCIIWNFSKACFAFGYSGHFQYYNTVYNCSSRGLIGKHNTFTSEYNVIFDCSPCWENYWSHTGSIFNKCASSDGSGSEIAFRNLDPATELESFVDTDGDSFLRPKMDNATLNVALLHTDIMGNASTYIGAKGAPISSSSFSSLSSESSDSSLSSNSSLSSLSSESSSSQSLSSQSSFSSEFLSIGSEVVPGPIIDISSGDVSVVSTINVDKLLLFPSVIVDDNFNLDQKWEQVIVMYEHADGQNKRLVHKYKGGEWIARDIFSINANAGTWEKKKIILIDHVQDMLIIERDEIGNDEDLTIVT